MGVVWVFLDGVGLGSDDPAINPWAAVTDPTLIATESRPPSWPGAVWKPVDACLGIDGLPQSATGTTALFTGINAPAVLGRHLSGFPPRELQEIIHRHSVHRQARERGLKSTFANAYNDAYFRRPPFMQSVSTHAVRGGEIPFRMLDDYRAGRAVFHDLTGEMIRQQGNDGKLRYPGAPPDTHKAADEFRRRFARIHERAKRRGTANPEVEETDSRTVEDAAARPSTRETLPIIGPEEAARRIAGLARDYDLVLFEYIKTDLAGHARDRLWAAGVVDEVMTFLRTLLPAILPHGTLVIASDHGNSEALDVRTHTRAPVPAVAVGPLAERILDPIQAITDFTPAILDALSTRG